MDGPVNARRSLNISLPPPTPPHPTHVAKIYKFLVQDLLAI
jgi:hypothetical protein